MTATEIKNLLDGYRFRASAEAYLQCAISGVLEDAGIEFQREASLSPADRPDFMVGGVAIEVKVNGSTNALIRQLHRYAQHERVESILVVTNRARLTQLPTELGGKPLVVAALLDGGL